MRRLIEVLNTYTVRKTSNKSETDQELRTYSGYPGRLTFDLQQVVTAGFSGPGDSSAGAETVPVNTYQPAMRKYIPGYPPLSLSEINHYFRHWFPKQLVQN